MRRHIYTHFKNLYEQVKCHIIAQIPHTLQELPLEGDHGRRVLILFTIIIGIMTLFPSIRPSSFLHAPLLHVLFQPVHPSNWRFLYHTRSLNLTLILVLFKLLPSCTLSMCPRLPHNNPIPHLA